MAELWESAGFTGAERAQRRRVAAWTPAQRLAWLDAVVLEAYRTGALTELRARKQRAVLALWEPGSSAGGTG